ncbi:MAG TPA: pitrilysin family protein [Rhodocyclaceae bacterium]
MRKTLAPFLLLASLAFSGAAAAANDNTFETKLSNGLRVIVTEDHRSPTAVHMVWYRVGAMDEVDGHSGLAHALEHMMFKGTNKIPAGGFNKAVAEAGGRDNAFTSEDYTAYFQIVPKRALPEMMNLEADRMANLKVTPQDFASEIKVVMEERRLRTDDNPEALVYETLNASAFLADSYRRPVIGWMNDLEAMTWKDARDWYKLWYTPSNAYVVVVGDVNHQDVFRLAEQTYGKIKPHALPARRVEYDPVQVGIRRAVVKAPAKLSFLAMAWKAPKLVDVDHDRDPYALDVLAAVLDGHDAARFPRELVREQKVAQTAGTQYDETVRGESLFILAGQPAEGKTVGDLEAAFREQIKRIQDQGVTPEELERVKTQLIAAQVYKRDSMMAQAMEMGMMEASGHSWRDVDKIVAKLGTVTPEEVQGVAKKYFKDDTLTVATLDPQPLDTATPRKPAVQLKPY